MPIFENLSSILGMACLSEADTVLSQGGYAKRHRTRASILDAALAEASVRGLHRASVTGIAARANTAVGSLNYHFGFRAELLRATMRKLMADFSARMAALEDRGAECTH
ncbi:MAG: helix-turn-helix domain-containing protein, partial [Mycobacterium sp.]